MTSDRANAGRSFHSRCVAVCEDAAQGMTCIAGSATVDALLVARRAAPGVSGIVSTSIAAPAQFAQYVSSSHACTWIQNSPAEDAPDCCLSQISMQVRHVGRGMSGVG